jgi:hypothetical protein
MPPAAQLALSPEPVPETQLIVPVNVCPSSVLSLSSTKGVTGLSIAGLTTLTFKPRLVVNVLSISEFVQTFGAVTQAVTCVLSTVQLPPLSQFIVQLPVTPPPQLPGAFALFALASTEEIQILPFGAVAEPDIGHFGSGAAGHDETVQPGPGLSTSALQPGPTAHMSLHALTITYFSLVVVTQQPGNRPLRIVHE